MCSLQQLKNYFHRKLNLPRRCSSCSQRTRYRVGASSPIKNVRICWGGRRSEVRVIQNVEDFRSELNVESFGNTLDVIVLKQREVQRGDAWTNQNIAPGISAKVEAWQSGKPTGSVQSRILGVVNRNLVTVRVDQTVRHRVAVRVPESKIWRRWNLETFRLDVPRRIPGLCEGVAAGSTQPVHECPIVAAVCIGGV